VCGPEPLIPNVASGPQIAGAVVGALLETLLIPGLHLGKNPFRAPGCFYPGHINGWQCALASLQSQPCDLLLHTVATTRARPGVHAAPER
jgi:hypothetical protein